MFLYRNKKKITILRGCNYAYGAFFFSRWKVLGPVQSVVSLTSLLRVISLTVWVDSIYNILIFFAEKMKFFKSKTYFNE